MNQKKLTPMQWVKVKIKTWQLKRRWNHDADFRNRVQNAVQTKADQYVKSKLKEKYSNNV